MTPKEFLKNKGITKATLYTDRDTYYVDNLCDLLEEYASQFKYDFTKNCTCKDRIGETWCCNQCGRPIPARYDKPLINQ